jgi:hypothetical protein
MFGVTCLTVPDRLERSDDFRSPLWAVAIGTACLLAAMAAMFGIGMNTRRNRRALRLFQ